MVVGVIVTLALVVTGAVDVVPLLDVTVATGACVTVMVGAGWAAILLSDLA